MARDTITPQQAASGARLRALFGSRCAAARAVDACAGPSVRKIAQSECEQLPTARARVRRGSAYSDSPTQEEASMHGRTGALAAMTVAGRRERMGVRPATSAIRQRNVSGLWSGARMARLLVSCAVLLVMLVVAPAASAMLIDPVAHSAQACSITGTGGADRLSGTAGDDRRVRPRWRRPDARAARARRACRWCGRRSAAGQGGARSARGRPGQRPGVRRRRCRRHARRLG